MKDLEKNEKSFTYLVVFVFFFCFFLFLIMPITTGIINEVGSKKIIGTEVGMKKTKRE